MQSSNIRTGFKRFIYLLAAFLTLSNSINIAIPVYAEQPIEPYIDKFAANDITFYNPTECASGMHSIAGNCGGEIDADTQEERFRQFVEGYGVVAMNLQVKYGVPWELVFAQSAIESGICDSGVAAGVAERGKYNCMGHMHNESAFYNSAEVYESGRGWSMYDSIPNMIAGHMVDFLRNGIYADAFQYTDPNNYDYEQFFWAMIRHYAPESENNQRTYWEVVKQYTEKAHEIAAEKGWPTSAELAREQNIPIGGEYPDINTNIHKQIDAEPHSLNMDCSGGDGSLTGSNNAFNGDGSDITFIGDSISVFAHESYHAFDDSIAKADFHIQSGKKFSGAANPGGEGGIEILEGLAKSGELRGTLVFALGSNNGNGAAVSQADIDKLLDLAKKTKRIVLVTNYYPTSANEYSTNNELFRKAAEENDKVVIADWKEAASKDKNKYLLDGGTNVHPTEEGGKLFAKVILEALGKRSEVSDISDDCECVEDGLVSIDGGLTDEQIQALADYFRDPSHDSLWTPSRRKWNCVSMSSFFVQMFTSAGGEPAINEGAAKKPCLGCANGVDVTSTLVNSLGLKHGSEPRPLSIFSVSGPSAHATKVEGHTGIVTRVEGDTIHVLEAGWGSDGWIGISTYELSSMVHNNPDIMFAYLDDIIDPQALAKAVGGSVGTVTSDGVASSKVTWKDGWISGGLSGFQKDPVASTGDVSHEGDFTTKIKNSSKPGPNKILLHSTEGTPASSGKASDIYGSSGFPPHFTINLKEKKVYQHFPITKPSDAIKAHDDTAGVQIEIIGFSTEDRKDNEWYLHDSANFGPDEWAYLAELLAAISAETKIPLTSSVTWSGTPERLSAEAFAKYEGILGHMHAPDNDHTDPGNLWGPLSQALSKVKGSDKCGNKSFTGDFPHYNQGDPKWGDESYGGCGTIRDSGCGPSSFAMMATALTGTVYTPSDTAKVAGDKGMHVCGSGSSHMLPETIAGDFGLEAKDLGTGASVDEINKYLRDGWMIWTCGSGPNPFTSGGHCIGIRGVTDDGRWLLADSNGNQGKENTLEKDFDPDFIRSHMRPVKAIRAK